MTAPRLLSHLRLAARRQRVWLAALLFAVLALPQALPAARTLLLGDVPPSLQALCSSASGLMGQPGAEAGHGHDCCPCQGPTLLTVARAAIAPAPELPALVPQRWLQGTARPAAWSPQRSRAPPASHVV